MVIGVRIMTIDRQGMHINTAVMMTDMKIIATDRPEMVIDNASVTNEEEEYNYPYYA